VVVNRMWMLPRSLGHDLPGRLNSAGNERYINQVLS
jgi:hypothetical protein